MKVGWLDCMVPSTSHEGGYVAYIEYIDGTREKNWFIGFSKTAAIKALRHEFNVVVSKDAIWC